jgi:signal transduction histidine kinase/Co/Zn/Cd efflux system component
MRPAGANIPVDAAGSDRTGSPLAQIAMPTAAATRLGALACTLAALLALASLLLGSAVAADPKVQRLAHARFLMSGSAEPPAPGAGQEVPLPDDWERTRPEDSGYGWYLFDWTRPGDPARICAVYLLGTTLPVEVYVNGHLIGATGALLGPQPNSWQRSQLFVIPADLLADSLNRIALRVYRKPGAIADMGPLLAGPEPALRERSFRDLFLHTLAPMVVSVTIIVLGIFIIVLWLRRRDPTYGLFGFAAILWGVHTGFSVLPSPLLPPPHWGVWWTSMYMLFVGLLCLFCLRFADVESRPLRRAVIGFVVAVPVVLYAAVAFGMGYRAGVLVRLTGIVLVLFALAAVARSAFRRRDTESLLLLFAGGISAGFGVHDWLVAQDTTEIRPLMLVPYAGVAFLTLVGWILTDRFVRALNESEALNAGLEQRVAEKSDALNAQLAATRAARDAAESANQAKTRFLAAASHDLRQPLHALGLFASRLADRTRDPEDAALVQRITTSVASLDSLFSALLDISKLEAGVVTAQRSAVRLDALFDRIANDFAPEAIERDLKIAVLPTARVVWSDPLLLERILRNLVANALRYTDAGGVVVGARPRGGRVSIEVWDSGPGIAAENLERVFEEFYQIGNPQRDRARGLGLGLAIVRRLAMLLGHQIQVASRMGRGTVFRVLADAAPAAALAWREAAEGLPTDPLTGRRVLVVDDEEPVREGMRQTLHAWGCAPLVAAGTREAVALCGSGAPPDAVVADYRLPDGDDGLAAIAEVRRACGRDVPAIIVSGESSSGELARIKAAGIPLLHKPVNAAKLRAALAFAIGSGPNAA